MWKFEYEHGFISLKDHSLTAWIIEIGIIHLKKTNKQTHIKAIL